MAIAWGALFALIHFTMKCDTRGARHMVLVDRPAPVHFGWARTPPRSCLIGHAPCAAREHGTNTRRER
jgi:hypothetical protein